MTRVKQRSDELVANAQDFTAKAARPDEYRQGWFRKEQLIEDIIDRDNVSAGLIAVICVQETCRTVKLVHSEKRPRLIYAKRPQRLLYYYSFDPGFGRFYIRLATWFPTRSRCISTVM